MTKPILYMLVGLPGSGKSTFATELSYNTGAIICSSDEMRITLCGDENSQNKNPDVFTMLHKKIKELLKLGRNVIYDATNISSKRRSAFLKTIGHIDCVKKCIIIATPYEVCIRRNLKRQRRVPEAVIKRMYMNWNTPFVYEGWDNILFYYYDSEICNYLGSPMECCQKLIDYQQNNSHHKLTLGEHMLKTWDIIANDEDLRTSSIERYSVLNAALIHDIGKPFTKTYKNGRGEKTSDAHYYQHHCVGAYDGLFVNCENKLYCSVLINLHMYPYFWEQDKKNEEKLKEKYRKFWGDQLYGDVMLLHLADSKAH